MSRESRAKSSSRAVPGIRNLWAVVPAGGFGTRLWPLSRAARPKFLLPLLGERSLLQQTLDRLAPSVPPERTLVVCGPAHAAPVARQLPALPERNSAQRQRALIAEGLSPREVYAETVRETQSTYAQETPTT